MRSRAFRALGLISVGLGPVILLAGCGEQETGARTTLNSIQPSSYVVRPPVTTQPPDEEADTDDGVDEDGRSDLPQEYTVQAGDFPLRIANLYDISLEELAAFNDWTPPNYAEFPNIGDTVGIPPGALVPGAGGGTGGDAGEGGNGDGGESVVPGEVPSTTLAGGDGECVPGEHVIVEGDIPVRVAEQYDISLEQLQAANSGNPAFESFIVGETIRIPCD
ncbi:MAG: LysM peptidoglycan-binding domain-containing protein [Thermoleophilaceae bacterium]